MTLTAKRPSHSPDKSRLLTQVSGEGTKRLNSDVDHRLYQQIKLQCVLEGRNISEMTRHLWVEYLKKAKKTQ